MGLYDDDKNAVTSGDVLDVIYWQTKFAARKLEAALKSRQPEYAIRGLIPSVVNGCTDVLTTYPNHGEVKQWMDNAQEIEKKIDPNAPPEDFTSAFGQWKDYSYEAGWRFSHLAKMAAQAGDWAGAHSHASDAGQHLGRALDRMAAWPAEVQSWIKSSHAEMQLLQEDAAKKK